MQKCVNCIHYEPCREWARDAFGEDNQFPYDAEENLCKHYQTNTEYTTEQYLRVLNKSADIKNAIDELRAMTKNGIPSWTEFGKCLDAIYKARDEYMKVQHQIVLEAAHNRQKDQKTDVK